MSHQNSPGPERYHSIDIRPSNDSDGVMSPPTAYPPGPLPDPYSSQTSLAGQHPPGHHPHFKNNTSNITQRYLSPNPGTSQTGLLSDDKQHLRPFHKLDEKGNAPNTSRHSSYDIFTAGENFDTRNATQAHLTFAEGDFVKTRAGRFYAYLLNLSIVTRWLLYIVPFAALLWIPGILGFTAFPNGNIWHVKLLWWSLWFTVLWVGWWVALAFSMMLPVLLRWTIGMAAVRSRHYIDWFHSLKRYIAFFAWALASWISFQALIKNRMTTNDQTAFPGSANILVLISKLNFGIMLCSAVLLGEKFAIQLIAYNFHQRSYADRIAEQKIHIKALVVLYSHSSDIPGRNDTLKDAPDTKPTVNPKKILKSVLKGVRGVAEGATTALGNVASEITGTSTLQPSSPEAKVYTALASANKTRLLARRLFYSFRREGASDLVIGDIARFFVNVEQAQVAFALFDKDGNGDATREEIEMSCLEVHRELLSLTASMKDIDSAVSRLDNILVSLYVIVAALIMAVSLDATFTNLLTAAGSLLLAMSWLIGSSASEVLTSIIFLFIKHPYDIGDSVEIDKNTYTVKEIRLLSTVFVDSQGCATQAAHSAMATAFIRNHRRSGAESEPFTMEVLYDTSFEKIEELRAKMLSFVESRRRDFQPVFDVVVMDLPGQEKMVLKADIKYKSNNHVGALKAKRRNMWVCALKNSMADVGIFGPAGDTHAPPAPTQYTLVPWEDVDPAKHPLVADSGTIKEPRIPKGGDYNLADKNAVLRDDSDEIFGENQDLNLTNPKQTMARPLVLPEGMRSMPSIYTGPAEEYEMRSGAPGGPR